MRKEFKWNYDENEILNILINIVLKYHYLYKKFYKLINIIKPKVIIEVVHYDFIKMIFNEIADSLGIPTIELQHGTIYNDHLAYQYDTDKHIKQFPSEIFLFSDFWKKNMNPPIENKYLVATGFPFFETKLNFYKNKMKLKDKYTILFISQSTIGIYLYNLACDVAKHLDDKKYKIIFKLHPAEYSSWKDNYPNLHTENIEVIDNNNESIYYYFQKSDMQIGAYSTALFEGIGFGLQTLIYKVGHYYIMDSLVKSKYANYVENAEEVIKEINQNKKNPPSDTNALWKPNSFENMVNHIKKYLEI